jgi:cobalamin biosynthesis protein CobT
MDLSNKELVKSLTSLIDDTLQEIEEIKKSKFAASEIKIEGPGSGIDGKPVNGDLHAKKEDKDEDEKEDDNDKDDMDKKEDMKSEDESEEEKKKKEMKKKEDEDKESKEHEDKESKKEESKEEMKDLKKSLSATEDLIKSYESKLSSFEEKLSKMAAAFEAMANAPVSRKGVPAGVTALQKSVEEYAPLNKTDVANKLFDLKKSGTKVDSSDVFRVETTKDSDELRQIAHKYGIK